MKHLLKHTKIQILQELDTLQTEHQSDPVLECAYENLIDSIDRVRDQIEYEERRNETPLDQLQKEIQNVREQADRIREERYGPKRDVTDRPSNPSRPPNEPQVGLDSPFEKSGSGDFDHEHFDGEGGWDGASGSSNKEREERRARKERKKESFEEMKENVENVSAKDLDPDRLRELADIAEGKRDDEEINPRDMSDNDFQKLLSRLRPNLVDWATGRNNIEQKFDKEDIAGKIRDALRLAQSQSEDNIEMLRVFQEQVSDNLFEIQPGDKLDIDEDEIRNVNEENIHPNDVRDPRKP